MRSSRKNKRKAWVGTIIFHSLLIFLFFYTGLSYTIPPPPEEGISINFGKIESAVGENEVTYEEIEEVIENNISETQNIEKIITQENIETLETNKEDKDKEKIIDKSDTHEIEEEEEEEEEEENTINKRAIFNPKKNKENEGILSDQGDMGDEEGDTDSKYYEKKGFGDGLSGIGNYRSIPKDLDHPLEMGKGYITVNVKVKSTGEIIEIDDDSFFSTLGYIGKPKRKKLYKSIKEQLRYGPATGQDKSDQIATLKLNFTH